MIEDAVSLAQSRAELQRMEEVVSGLLRDGARWHPDQLALLLEGPLDVIDQLRREIDEYLGLQTARRLLAVRTEQPVVTAP